MQSTTPMDRRSLPPPARPSRAGDGPTRLSNSIALSPDDDLPFITYDSRTDSGLEHSEKIAHVPARPGDAGHATSSPSDRDPVSGSDTTDTLSTASDSLSPYKRGRFFLPPISNSVHHTYQASPTPDVDIVLKPYGDAERRLSAPPFPAPCPFSDCTNDNVSTTEREPNVRSASCLGTYTGAYSRAIPSVVRSNVPSPTA